MVASKVTQLGAPVRVYWAAVGVGAPVTTTWKWADAVPELTVVLAALVIVGATAGTKSRPLIKFPVTAVYKVTGLAVMLMVAL